MKQDPQVNDSQSHAIVMMALMLQTPNRCASHVYLAHSVVQHSPALTAMTSRTSEGVTSSMAYPSDS
jgi:hypothetical protein